MKDAVEYINKILGEQRPENTNMNWRSKILEYKSFCLVRYGEDDTPFLITAVKVYMFLFYQAHHQKKEGEWKKEAFKVIGKDVSVAACKYTLCNWNTPVFLNLNRIWTHQYFSLRCIPVFLVKVHTNLVYSIFFILVLTRILVDTTGLRDPMADEKIDHPEAYLTTMSMKQSLLTKK